MARKEFIIDNRGYALVGDERDIMVDGQHYQSVINWCIENEIDARVNSSPIASSAFGKTLWKVEDEAQRLVFMLRWN
jgi:hypothetical protein